MTLGLKPDLELVVVERGLKFVQHALDFARAPARCQRVGEALLRRLRLDARGIGRVEQRLGIGGFVRQRQRAPCAGPHANFFTARIDRPFERVEEPVYREGHHVDFGDLRQRDDQVFGPEPREAIMRSFELPIIGRFFGDYRDEMLRRLAP